MKALKLNPAATFRQVLFAVVSALTFAVSSHSQTAATDIQISNGVVQAGVHRLGVNLGDQSYWDSGQIMKNLVFTNPGFEGLKYRVIVHCSVVAGNRCQDDNGYNGQPAGYWAGGSYLVISGNANGTSGTVVNNTPNPVSCGSCGPTIEFDQSLSLAVGDYVALSKYFPGAGDAGWWDDTKGGGTITTETNDLSPNTPGQQAVVLAASQPGARAAVTQYFDSYSNLSFVQLNGSFEVTFRAKGIGGNNQLNVNVTRSSTGFAPYLNQTLTLTNQWQDYTLNFSASETGTAVGTVGLAFGVSGSTVELDDVSMDQTNSSSSNPTVFRDDVVNALRQLNPGTIRMMAAGAALGSDIPNQLQTVYARYRGGFNADQVSESSIAYGIHEFLQLCQTVGSDPWITIPTSTTPQEMTEFMQYLNGTGSDAWSSLRIARGQTAPWSTVFNKIHIELGNETWNGDFKGESMNFPAYPQWANKVFGAARQSAGFSGSKFDLVLDGWSQVPWYDTQLLSYSTQHDSIDIAPYLMYSLNNEAQSTMFGAMMAEPEMFESAGGIVNQIVTGAQNAPTPTKVNVYETNLGSMIGSPTQAQLDALAPSVAAGIATADHMMQMMRLGVGYQNAFSLPQFGFRRGDGKTVKLWGLVVDMGTTNRRRPQFLTEALANSVIGGNMLQTVQSGANPTWNQPLSSDNVQVNGAHYIQSFAFLNGTAASTVIFNLSLTNTLPVTFSGFNAPNGMVQMTQITSANMTDNNETSDVIEPVTQSLNAFNGAAGISLPPFSMTVLNWTSNVAQAPQFSVAAGTYSTTQTVTISDTTAGATTYYTTDGSTPTTGSNLYAGPLTVSATTTVNAISAAAGMTTSPVATAVYTIQPFVAVPAIQVPAGTYSVAQSVAIIDLTVGARVYYTTDGSTPSVNAHLYTGPITVSCNETLQAIAVAQSYSNSPVVSATYTIAPPAPTPYFTTGSGSYTSAQTVAILDAVGGSIYYTTDGSTPTKNSNLYTSLLKISATETLSAIAIAPGFSSSTVTVATYTISTLAAQPVMSVAGGTYSVAQYVALTDKTAGATIYYTVDGSTPSLNSPVYAGPIKVDASQYMQAAAVAQGYKLSSIASAMYSMVASAPSVNLPAGSYKGTQVVTLTDATPNAVIFYTLDGSNPTTQSASYSGPITMKASGKIVAMAGRKGYANSPAISASYTINAPGVTTWTPAPSFMPVGGTYSGAKSVAISDAVPGATIYYTTDGSTPTQSSTKYTVPVSVAGSEVLKAQAYVSGASNSAIALAAYVIVQPKTLVVPFAKGFAANQIHLNGSAKMHGNALQLVSGLSGQGGTGWFKAKVSISSFESDFDLQMPSSSGDGLTFTIQDAPAAETALGGNARGMGYQTIQKSVALAFEINHSTTGNIASVGVYVNGAAPKGASINLAGGAIDLHSGHTFHIQVSYDNGTMTIVLTDKVTGATVTENFKINVAETIGSSMAYVGFTGSTGGHTSIQNILDWTFSN